MERVGFLEHQADDGVAGLVVGGQPPVLLADHDVLALEPHDDLVFGLLEVLAFHRRLVAAGGHQGRLVGQVGDVGAGEAGDGAGDLGQIRARGEHDPVRMHLEDLEPALDVGQADGDLPVEAAGAEQGRVEDVGPVGGGHHDHRLP